MTTSNGKDMQNIKELAAAVSTQARVSNQAWLGLLAVAVAALLPQSSDGGLLELPGRIGKVDATLYYPTLFAMLVVVTLAFCSAQAQTVRAQSLAQSFVDTLGNGDTITGIHPRELFDMMRLPSLNRVAPLAQYIRGPYQWFRTEQKCPFWLRAASTTYFILLRFASIVVYYGLPTAALRQVYERVHVAGLFAWFVPFGAGLAASALLIVLIGDGVYLILTVPRIWKGNASRQRSGHRGAV